MITRFGARRRDPISRDRYRAIARGAGVIRPARSRVLEGLLAVALVATAAIAFPRVTAGVGAGMEQLVASIQSAVPLLQGSAQIELPPGGSTSIGAAPVVDALPAFTREPALRVSGRVPSFAVEVGRALQYSLNGATIKTEPLEPSGAFTAALALREGTNTIGIALLSGGDVVASTTHTVVLDRTPPALAISRPQPGATVDAKDVVVAGTAEAGSTVTVDERTVVTTLEGIYSDSFSAEPGTVEITVVARDRAGNETTQKVSIVAVQVSQVIGATVTVTLDRPTVRPGQFVVATIRVSDARGPRAGVPATLSVGIVSIGTAITDGTGIARIPFAAPGNEGQANVVVLAAGASGSAPLTISAR